MWGKYPIQQLVAPAYLANTPTLVYESPFAAGDNSQTWVSTFWIINVTAAIHTIQLYLVPDGGSPAANNALLYNQPIETVDPTRPFFIQTADGMVPLKIIPAGSDLYASADAASAVTFCMDGAEIQG